MYRIKYIGLHRTIRIPQEPLNSLKSKTTDYFGRTVEQKPM